MTTTVRPEPPTPRRSIVRPSRPRHPRVVLQRRAPGTIQRHLSTTMGRVVGLVLADLTTFVVLRAALQAIRAGVVGGNTLSQFARVNLSEGYLGGWQFGVALVIGLLISGSYGQGDNRRQAGRLLHGVALATGLVLWYGLWSVPAAIVVLQFAVTTALVWPAIFIERCGVDYAIDRIIRGRGRGEKTVFVGDPSDPAVCELCAKLVENKRIASQGWIQTGDAERVEDCLGTPGDVWDILQRIEVDTLVFCGPVSTEVFKSVMEATTVAGCRILSVPRYDGIGRVSPRRVWHRGLPFVELTIPSLIGQQKIIKRVLDVVGSFVGLLLLSPLLVVVAVLIKLDSPGPVLFAQDRVGFGGCVFRMAKFRTMRDGADDDKEAVAHLNHSGDSRLFKVRNDPRITRVGAWLRRWSVDELPQLWNVLVGEMAFVGPRPFFESDLIGYEDHHFDRLGAQPGITGLWQVKGRSSVVDFEEVVRLDREYIDRWSLWLDLKILLLTPSAVLSRHGAF